jgi:hypothetical protein
MIGIYVNNTWKWIKKIIWYKNGIAYPYTYEMDERIIMSSTKKN